MNETATMLRPHEGVTGTDRTDDLLSLEPSAMAHRDLIARLAYAVYDACLVGNQAPSVRETYERVKSPQLGDLVYVTDYHHARSAPVDTRQKSLGILVARRSEWWSTDEQWAAEKAEDGALTDDERMIEPDAIYVQYGNESVDVCRWTNCRIIQAVPACDPS